MIDNRLGGPIVSTRPHRLAWLRLNAYGLLLVGLLLLAATEVTGPRNSQVARVVAAVEILQPAWTLGYGIAGLLLLYGFFRARSGPEVLGLGIMLTACTVQTVVLTLGDVVHARDWIVWALVVGVVSLRTSALLSKDGLTFTIPGRG
jgi:hypothetical protein